jgi:hypothetical protein
LARAVRASSRLKRAPKSPVVWCPTRTLTIFETE